MSDSQVSKEQFSQMVREFLRVSPKHEIIFARAQRVAIGQIRGWAEGRAPHPLGIPTHVDFMREHMRSCVCKE